MRRFPWHVALRADRRAVMTGLGIALGLAFVVASVSLPQRLATQEVDPQGRLASTDFVVRPRDGAGLPPEGIGVANATMVRVHRGTAVDGTAVVLASFDGPYAPDVPVDGARRAFEPGGDFLRLSAPIAEDVALAPPIETPWLARGWYVVGLGVAERLGEPDVSYVVASGLPREEVRRLQEEGYQVDIAPAVAPFFAASVDEVARDLTLVVAFTSVLVALFAHEFIASEVRERRSEMGIMRAVGLRVRDVAALFVARAVIVAGVGAAAGVMLALAMLALAARVSGSSVFGVSLSAGSALLVVAATFVAAVSGAAGPAYRGARRTVDQLMRAVP